MRLKTIRFYAPDGNGGAEPPAGDPAGGASGQNQQEGGQNITLPSFDYEKLAGIIQGKQNVAEDTVLNARTIPYLLKMADLTNCLSQDGKVDDEAMKKALNQVLEDVPALKPTEGSKHGFVQIGTGGGSEKPEGGNPPTPMPTKRWNRFH